MFTGIIEATGRVEAIEHAGANTVFWISSPLSHELKPDQSISHNGVCLTVEEVGGNRHRVTAIAETLAKTTLAQWQTGRRINLERCMLMNGRLDGHIVQGHVDVTAACTDVREAGGSHVYRFSFPPSYASLVVEKGSICLDGISLTAHDVDDSSFSVSIIPYTYQHTAIQDVKPGQTANIEFDIIGKYAQRYLQLQKRVDI